MGRTRIRRREREEELPPVEEIEASPEEVELSDFPDGLGPQGISEVSLYRLLPRSGRPTRYQVGPTTEPYVRISRIRLFEKSLITAESTPQVGDS